MIYLKIFGLFLVMIIAILAMDYSSILWQSVVAPKRAAVQREVFENTKSYREGKKQELVKYRLEFLRSKDEADKAVIAATVRQSWADVSTDELEPELKQFLNICNNYGVSSNEAY